MDCVLRILRRCVDLEEYHLLDKEKSNTCDRSAHKMVQVPVCVCVYLYRILHFSTIDLGDACFASPLSCRVLAYARSILWFNAITVTMWHTNTQNNDIIRCFHHSCIGYTTNTLTNANVGIGKSSLDSHTHFRQSGKRFSDHPHLHNPSITRRMTRNERDMDRLMPLVGL